MTMVSNVNSIITSGALGGGLIPTEYATQIIQDAPKSSVSLTRMRQIRMSTRTRTQPVLDSKPIAYWVGGDTGLKQTTKMKWSGLSITAEELAAIVPIPEAVIADSGIPIWPEVMPRLTSALGYKLDQATLFGVDKPSSFPDGIIPQAIDLELLHLDQIEEDDEKFTIGAGVALRTLELHEQLNQWCGHVIRDSVCLLYTSDAADEL